MFNKSLDKYAVEFNIYTTLILYTEISKLKILSYMKNLLKFVILVGLQKDKIPEKLYVELQLMPRLNLSETNFTTKKLIFGALVS